MVRDYDKIEMIIAEDDLQHPLSIAQKYSLLNAMYEEARRLGHFRMEDVSKGLQDKITLARIMNAASIPYMVIGG